MILAMTFGITALACVSEYIQFRYDGQFPGKRDLIVSLRAANTVIPIVLGITVTIYNVFSPVSKWATIKFVRSRAISEIYRYRCRIGEYRPKGAGNSSSHRNQFMKSLRSIWDDLEGIEVVKSGVYLGFQDNIDPMESMYESIIRTKRNKNLLNRVGKDPAFSTGSGARVFPQRGHSHAKNSGLNKYSMMDASNSQQQGSSFGAGVNDSTSLQGGSDAVENIPDRPMVPEMTTYSAHQQSTRKGTARPQLQRGMDVLTAEEYIMERVFPEIHRLEQETPKLSLQFRGIQVLVIILSSVGAALAAYNLQIWIPVLLSIVHVMDSVMNFRQLPLKIQRANISFARLKQILLWWTGLSLIEQRIPRNLSKIVRMVENVILSEVETVTQAQLKSENADEDDEGGGRDTDPELEASAAGKGAHEGTAAGEETHRGYASSSRGGGAAGRVGGIAGGGRSGTATGSKTSRS